MNLRLRTVFLFSIAIIVLWFFYIERPILTPFILAAIFAYIFNPLINLFSKYLKFPRSISIIFVYIIIIFSVFYLGSFLIRELIRESESIRLLILNYINSLKSNVNDLPLFIQPYVLSYTQIPKIKFETLGLAAFPVVTFAFSGILNFFVFIFSTFFFLKDNEKVSEKILLMFPQNERIEVASLINKINNVLSKYLRGQIILIISLAVILFILFSFLGIKNALTISIFSALAGIVPIIGTIIAIIVGTFIIVLSGGVSAFQLGLVETILLVIGVYYFAQLIQDYILSPFILGKAVRLHPVVILFAALAGGNLGGILGLVLAVPVAASLKIIFEYLLDKINHRDYAARKNKNLAEGSKPDSVSKLQSVYK